MKKRILITITIIIILVMMALGLLDLTRKNNEQVIASTSNTKINNTLKNSENIDYSDSMEDPNVVLTVGSNYDVNKMSSDEIMNNNDYYLVIGKVTSIDGATNYNDKQNVYTTIFSLGKMEIIQDLKGNMKNNTIDIMKRGGKISLEQYEKSLTTSQKQKDEMKSLLNKYSSQKSTKLVEAKSLDEIDVQLNKEYLFTLSYNKDYDRYLINAFPYAIKEVKRDGNKLLLKNNESNQFEEYSSIEKSLK